MRAFADLLDRLTFAPQRNAKLRLMEAYFRSAPDPDRGWALAALTSGLAFANARRGVVRELVAERVDPVLFGLSRDYVGDTAETVALIWPKSDCGATPPTLGEVVARLRAAGRSEVHALLASWLDRLDPSARFALVKLITGGLRVGVSARLAKQAVANFAGVDIQRVEGAVARSRAALRPALRLVGGQGPRARRLDEPALSPAHAGQSTE